MPAFQNVYLGELESRYDDSKETYTRAKLKDTLALYDVWKRSQPGRPEYGFAKYLGA